jgi:hypothetical protein
MLTLYLLRASWVAAITLLIAFILTFLRRQPALGFAAVFYSIGTLVNIGVKVYGWGMLTVLGYSLSDSGSPNTSVLYFLPIPIGALAYAIAAVVLLWPGISQEKAIRRGKILHLIFLPLLVSIIFIGGFLSEFPGHLFSDLVWLIYGPLWFRIRESYGVFPGAYRPIESR